MTITVKQFGLLQASGTLASIVDGDTGTGWAPGADGLETYTASFLNTVGQPNSAASFPGFEFDFGVSVRVASFMFETETTGTLARGMLIASNNPATGVADMVQSGDVLLGIYEQDEVNSGRVLQTRARDLDIRGRYVRFVMRTSDPAVPDTSDEDYVDPASGNVFSTPGPFAYVVPEYSGTFTIEGWGGGASGGVSANAQDGGQTRCQPNDSTLLLANGGSKSALTVANSAASSAAGGTASGANTANTTGGSGGTPSPTTTASGTSGAGGAAPNGGAGGVAVTGVLPSGPSGVVQYGNAGAVPGGGGSGRYQWVPSGDLLSYKYPGGASGGYFKHVLTRGAGGPEPGDIIIGVIGAGGVSNTGDGAGAHGRVKFSF